MLNCELMTIDHSLMTGISWNDKVLKRMPVLYLTSMTIS